MPKYRFSAAGLDGAVVTGVQNATKPSEVRSRLLEQDLQPITIAQKNSILQLQITQKKVKKRDLMHFCSQLSVFLHAGVSILEALVILSDETSEKMVKKALVDIREALEGGDRFSDAAAAHPELFPSYSVEILRSAELTGNLDEVLGQLADYLEREIDTAAKINAAMMYPAIVMVLALVVSVVLVVYVLPKFTVFFASLNAKLPLPTRMLLGFSDIIQKFGLYFGAVVVVVGILTVIGLRTPRGKRYRDILLLKLPVLGDVIKTAILERFCRLLASMTAAGVSLPEAIAVTTGATANAVFRERLTLARAAMMRGEGLAGPLAATGLFPGAARQMFAVGENTGTLDDQLVSAADYFDRELDHKVKRFTTLLEPAVIVGVGVVVGFVAVALVSAMYGIFNQVKVT